MREMGLIFKVRFPPGSGALDALVCSVPSLFLTTRIPLVVF